MAAVCYGYDITHGENRGAVSMMDERWLSVDEIAEYLGVGRETIYNWIEKRDAGNSSGRKLMPGWSLEKLPKGVVRYDEKING